MLSSIAMFSLERANPIIIASLVDSRGLTDVLTTLRSLVAERVALRAQRLLPTFIRLELLPHKNFFMFCISGWYVQNNTKTAGRI